MFFEWDIAFLRLFGKKVYLSPFQQDYTKKAGERILKIGKNLAANRAAMKELFADCGDIVFRDLRQQKARDSCFWSMWIIWSIPPLWKMPS